ncbi:hypothetical protein CYMTET_15532 [Cymbomonas tetramitiformis]|uniref:Thioredoxin domain-containing protein n=1 Tax=Cymbomonas tetramitiformis TaxID=36881 RepID=A0AAE0GE07_9CHLO|nr:hypothetical protein CYMTET_15532 [Cymbomonas tetramitiformis]
MNVPRLDVNMRLRVLHRLPGRQEPACNKRANTLQSRSRSSPVSRGKLSVTLSLEDDGTVVQNSRRFLVASVALGSALFGAPDNTNALTMSYEEARIATLETELRKVRMQELAILQKITEARADRAAEAARIAGPLPVVPDVLELYPDTWDVAIGQQRAIFVEFYAPWCPYCKRLEPIWKELAEESSVNESGLQIARINADKYTEFMDRYDVEGYPTLILFKEGRPISTYRGRAELQALKTFVNQA